MARNELQVGLKHYATKADLNKMESNLMRRGVLLAIGVATLLFAALRFPE